jgi:hypothetical protein
VAAELQCRLLHPTVGEATSISGSKTAKENSSYFEVILFNFISF